MSERESPRLASSGDEGGYSKEPEKNAFGPEPSIDGRTISKGEDLFASQDLDPALNAKMFIVNNVRSVPTTGKGI